MKTKVSVDPNICIGSGNCVVMAAKYFDLNNDGKSEVKLEGKKMSKEAVLELTSEQRKKILSAARACPVQAISVFDENGKKLFP